MDDRIVGIMRSANGVLVERRTTGFGKGYLTGIYGRARPGESYDDALVSELHERTGLRPLAFSQRGIILYAFATSPLELRMHLYDITAYDGTGLHEGLHWHNGVHGPLLPDYRLWLPRLMREERFLGRIVYESPENPVLLSHTLRQIRRPTPGAAQTIKTLNAMAQHA